MFFKIVQKYIKKHYPNKYQFQTKNQLYSLDYVINEIIYFMKSGVSYAYYRGKMSAKTLNKHILFFSRNNIFAKIYQEMYSKCTRKVRRLSTLSIDTSFIMNKYGRQNLGRNKLNKANI